jgi:hypothetical protein
MRCWALKRNPCGDSTAVVGDPEEHHIAGGGMGMRGGEVCYMSSISTGVRP